MRQAAVKHNQQPSQRGDDFRVIYTALCLSLLQRRGRGASIMVVCSRSLLQDVLGAGASRLSRTSL